MLHLFHAGFGFDTFASGLVELFFESLNGCINYDIERCNEMVMRSVNITHVQIFSAHQH